MGDLENKKTLKIFAVIVVVILLGSSLVFIWYNTQSSSGAFIMIGFSEDRVYQDEVALLSNGPRLTGSDAEKKGAEYTATQFRNAGLKNVAIEKFPTTMFEVKNAEAKISITGIFGKITIDEKTLEHIKDFTVIGYSGSTTGRQKFEIIYVGNGTTSDFEEHDLKGKVALVAHVDVPSFSRQCLDAMSSGASALIVINDVFGGNATNYAPIYKSCDVLNSTGENVPIIDVYPTFNVVTLMVSKGIGDYILNAVKYKVKRAFIELDINVWRGKRDALVVTGDIVGAKYPNQFVMVGGHHDTVYNGPGAIDNTCGTATVIELARSLANFKVERTIKFATFGGEEEGIFGSRDWVKAHRETVEKNLIVYLNLDMPNVNIEKMGNNNSVIVVNENNSIPLFSEIKNFTFENCPQFKKYQVDIAHSEMLGGSDYDPFTKLNKTTSSFWGNGVYGYHTYLDDIDWVNPESLSLAGHIYGTYLLYMAHTIR